MDDGHVDDQNIPKEQDEKQFPNGSICFPSLFELQSILLEFLLPWYVRYRCFFKIHGKRKWLGSPHQYKILPDLLGNSRFWGQPEFYSYTMIEGTLLVKKPIGFSSLSTRSIEIRLSPALFLLAFAVFSFINFLSQRLERVETQTGFVFIGFFCNKFEIKKLEISR